MKRILCLHGKKQSKDIFRTKLGRIPHKMRSLATFHILDGPIEIQEEVSDIENNIIGRSWFDKNPTSGLIECSSVEKALNYIESYWISEGPFEGLLGFSMGGTMAAIMSLECNISRFPGIKFVICFGSPDFNSGNILSGTNISDASLTIPKCISSLHFAGTADPIISVESSLSLASRFNEDNRVFEVHSFGHCIPMKPETYERLATFLSL